MLTKDKEVAQHHIAEAVRHLSLVTGILQHTEVGQQAPIAAPLAVEISLGKPPHGLLDIAFVVINHILPKKLAQSAIKAATTPRDWLFQVYRLSCAPRGILEPVATIIIMLAAVRFGLRHRLLLQTEVRLHLPYKTAITDLDVFLATFISEMMAEDRLDLELRDWLKETVTEHYPNFQKDKRLHMTMTGSDYILIPDVIEPIEHQDPAPVHIDSMYTSPLDPRSNVLIPHGSGYRIEQHHGNVLEGDDYPIYNGQHHAGVDITRWNAYREPVYAMRAGEVIDSVYLPRGFGNTVTVEHDDKTCLRYTHLDKKTVKKGERVAQGQQIGTIGKGAKKQFAAHLHLDMPQGRRYARSGTYYKTLAALHERFINPLHQIAAQDNRSTS